MEVATGFLVFGGIILGALVLIVVVTKCLMD